MRPRVLAQGAVECLSKPFSDTALLYALNAAVRRGEYGNDGYRNVVRAVIYCESAHRRSRESRSSPCPTPRRLCSSLTTTSRCANRWSCSSEPQGGSPKTFASAQEFLSRPHPTVPCCLVLDVTLPGLSGLELQEQLAERTDMPIIFITGHGDVPMTVQAMKAGAVEFLTKPFNDAVLLDAIRGAIERSRTALREESEMQALRKLLRVTHSARTRSDGIGRPGSVEQTGRRRAWNQRDHSEGTPRSVDAQDEGRFSSRAGDNGLETRPADCSNGLTRRRPPVSFFLAVVRCLDKSDSPRTPPIPRYRSTPSFNRSALVPMLQSSG